MSTNNPKSTDVATARELLIKFIELHGKPGVRNDPVVKALLRGIVPGNSPFETASMTVATLRNAGRLDPDTKPPDPKGQGVTDTKGTAGKDKKDKDSTNKPKQKLRGFDRTVDVLLEDAVFRGIHPEKEAHPVAIALRKLRKDPDRMIKVVRLKAIYEKSTLANGKEVERLKDLVNDADGNPIVDVVEERRVKDMGDFDLLALEEASLLATFARENQAELFAWQKPPILTGDPKELDAVWPSLKGTRTLDSIKQGLPRPKLLEALRAEKFFRFGPSPTLRWTRVPPAPKAPDSSASA